ncbi:MAG: hypothetical protein ACREH8_09570 [Opitutaceae bacterium]
MNFPIKLPESTAGCEVGPIMHHSPGLVRVWYDTEGESSIVWTQIEFRSALATRFTPESAVTERMVVAYSRIAEVPESEWIFDIRKATEQKQQQLMPGVRHMMVFFDHHGCLEVVAKEVVITEKVAAPERS